MNRLAAATSLHDVTDFVFVENYVLKVRFDDGTERTIDFEPILVGPLFGPLRDPHVFRQVRVDHDLGTLVWPNGADIDPNVLYDWPQHVDAIIQRRQERWAVDYRARSERVQHKVAEAGPEPCEVGRGSRADDDKAE